MADYCTVHVDSKRYHLVTKLSSDFELTLAVVSPGLSYRPIYLVIQEAGAAFYACLTSRSLRP